MLCTASSFVSVDKGWFSQGLQEELFLLRLLRRESGHKCLRAEVEEQGIVFGSSLPMLFIYCVNTSRDGGVVRERNA